jgi:hypothetical protein
VSVEGWDDVAVDVGRDGSGGVSDTFEDDLERTPASRARVAPGMEVLYSAVTMTNPSNEAILSAQTLVCSCWYWA